MLIIVIVASFLYIQPIASASSSTMEFTQVRGNFNNTAATYYGFKINDLQVLVVAGSPSDEYAVHLVILQHSLDYLLEYDRDGATVQTKINSSVLTMVNYPELIAIRKTVLQTEVPIAELNFRNLDWHITTSKERTTQNEAQIQISVTAQQHISTHVYTGDIALQLNFNFLLTRKNGEQTTQIVKLTENGVSIANTTKSGSIVESSVKIDHILQSEPAIRADILKLPLHISISHRIIGLRTLPIIRMFEYQQRNVNDTDTARPEFSFRNSQLNDYRYSWDREITVDGVDRKTRVDSVHILPSRTITAVNSSYGIITNKLAISLNFLYPVGSTIVHDPTFTSSIFIDKLPFINFYPKLQLLVEIAVLVLFSIFMFRKLKKRH